MADHTPFFDLVGRDVSALLGIAEYLEVCGCNRVASLVRTVTFSIERTVSDLGHDLLHRRRRNKPKTLSRAERERGSPRGKGAKWQRLKPYEKFADMIDRH